MQRYTIQLSTQLHYINRFSPERQSAECQKI